MHNINNEWITIIEKRYGVFCAYFFDSNFVFKKNIQLKNLRSYQPYNFFYLNNKFYIAGESWYPPANKDRCLVLHKADTMFNYEKSLYWGSLSHTTDIYDLPASTRCLDITSDSMFFYAGGTKAMQADLISDEDSWYAAIKVDTALNVIWEKYIGGDAFYVLWSIKTTPDNGCMLVGARYDENFPENKYDPYVIKLDADGNPVSVKDLPGGFEIRNVLVYPNPGNAKLNYSCGMQETIQFEMYNMQGIKVISQTLYSPQGEIETTELPTGMYLYRFITSKACIQSGKWVKE